jgi:hypothetical protein
MSERVRAMNGRREAIYVALAAAEVCWVIPFILAFSRLMIPHPPFLLWLAVLSLLLGFFYFYRAVERANLSIWLQQVLLAVALLSSMALIFRFHLYANLGLQGIDWFLEPFRRLSDISKSIAPELITIFTLLYLWARGIHLARRSISIDSVGFSFRAGVLVLVWGALVIRLFTDGDVSSFVAPFFFFSLVAVALARIEEVSQTRGSSGASSSGFWIGSAVAAVAVLVGLSSMVAVFFSGGGLSNVLRFLSPLLIVVQVFLVAMALLIFGLLEFLFSIFRVNLDILSDWIQEAMGVFQVNTGSLPLIAPEGTEAVPGLGALRASSIVIIVIVAAALVLLLTWWRLHGDRHESASESRDSLLSASAVAQSLLAALRSGRDRLAQMAGLVDRFGLGARLLSAISIQRIYANLVRLAAKAGYPRVKTQTPYEYLEVLSGLWPGSTADMTLITDAYVNAHYGQVPDSRDELERIRRCWERVQAQASGK